MNYSDDDYYYSDDDEDEDEVNKQKEPEKRDKYEPPKYDEENDYIEFIPNFIKFIRNIKTGYITLDSFTSRILCRYMTKDEFYNNLKTDPFLIELVNLFQSRYKKYAFVYKTSELNPHFANILACYYSPNYFVNLYNTFCHNNNYFEKMNIFKYYLYTFRYKTEEEKNFCNHYFIRKINSYNLVVCAADSYIHLKSIFDAVNYKGNQYEFINENKKIQNLFKAKKNEFKSRGMEDIELYYKGPKLYYTDYYKYMKITSIPVSLFDYNLNSFYIHPELLPYILCYISPLELFIFVCSLDMGFEVKKIMSHKYIQYQLQKESNNAPPPPPPPIQKNKKEEDKNKSKNEGRSLFSFFKSFF